MGSRRLANVCVAVTLIILGIVLPLGYWYWLKTRTFNAADVPVSLSPGHITTSEFFVNFRATYFIEIVANEPSHYETGCQLGGSDSVLKTHLRLFLDGKPIGERDGSDYSGLAWFAADRKGYYRVDIDVLSDASCLNLLQPRIVVFSGDSYDYEYWFENLRWFSIIPILAGLGLLTKVAIVDHRLRHSAYYRSAIFGNVESEQAAAHSKFPSKRLALLPSFGLFCATAMSLVWAGFVFSHAAFRPISRGIWVSVLARQSSNESLPSIRRIVLRIEGARLGMPPRIRLNQELLPWKRSDGSWEELTGALKDELKGRPEWTVYVEADTDVAFGDVTRAIDVARGLHAKIVLLTPQASMDLVRPAAD